MKSKNHLSAFVSTEKRHLYAFIHALHQCRLKGLSFCLFSKNKEGHLIDCFLRSNLPPQKQKKQKVQPHKSKKRTRKTFERFKDSTTQKLFGTPLSVPKIRIHTNNAEYDVIFFVVFFFCDDGETDDANTKRLFVVP